MMQLLPHLNIWGIFALTHRMKRKWGIYLGFFIILIGAFWYFLFAGTEYYKVKLPVLSYVQDFTFTDQDGKQVTERDVKGKVYVAEYFFTTCKGICPKMNANMKGVYEQFAHEENFAILSHTCMPETDSVSMLKLYQKKLLGAQDSHNWHFMTGTKEELYKMARESYLLDNDKNNSLNIKDQFIHTQFFALVDKQRRVRGIYDGLKHEELDKLGDDIKALLKETKDHEAGLASPFSNNPG
ncbi:MAG: SCO family protein [Ginsengibacter sp.]